MRNPLQTIKIAYILNFNQQMTDFYQSIVVNYHGVQILKDLNSLYKTGDSRMFLQGLYGILHGIFRKLYVFLPGIFRKFYSFPVTVKREKKISDET